MKKVLYIDCLSGISGDMSIGALLDLGVEFEFLKNELNKLNLDGYEIECNKTQKSGITGTKFKVIIKHHHDFEDKNLEEKHHHHGRNYLDIINLIDNSSLNDKVKDLSKKVFLIIGEAESKIHNKTLDEIHFHEVGAIDSIIDIVGFSVCLVKLNVDEIIVSPLHIGSGFVKCEHGVIPVPAPATLEILKNIPIYCNGVKSELVTPTGASIVKAIANEFSTMPKMEIEKIGYGHGEKDLEITNTLRVCLCKKKL